MARMKSALGSSLMRALFTGGADRRNRKAAECSLLGVAFALLLSSCGAAGASSETTLPSLPALTSPGTVQVHKDVTNSVGAPAVFNLGSSPNMSLTRPLFISKSGFLVGAEINGNHSDIFERTEPLANWNFVGSIPGTVTQLDFDTLDFGFALVGTGIFSTDSLYSTSDGGRHWALVSTGKFVQVHFFNSRNGIALANPASGPGLGAEILITSDGGLSWTREPASELSKVSLFGSNYAGFSFVSTEVGWMAVGGQPSAGSEEKWLFRTVNGGRSWTQIANSPSFSSPETTLHASSGLPMGGYMDQVRFESPSSGYLILAHVGVLKTVDGGINWTGEQLLPGGGHRSTRIADIATATPFGGIAVTEAGSIWNQANSGAVWEKIYPPYRAASVSYSSGKIEISTGKGRVLALGGNSPTASKVLGNFGANTESVDIVPNGEIVITSTAIEIRQSGNGWTKMPVPGVQQINCGRFLNASVGLFAPGPLSAMLEATLSGGRSWTKIPLPFLPISLDPLSATNWWAIGEVLGPPIPNPYKKNLHTRTYALYHTANAGRSWTEYQTRWGASGILVGVNFYSPSVGYAWTENTLFATTDGGSTFVSRQLPSNQMIPNPASLATGSGGRAWMVTNSYPVFETKDSGASWSAMRQ